jgi:hypothetical protein
MRPVSTAQRRGPCSYRASAEERQKRSGGQGSNSNGRRGHRPHCSECVGGKRPKSQDPRRDGYKLRCGATETSDRREAGERPVLSQRAGCRDSDGMVKWFWWFFLRWWWWWSLRVGGRRGGGSCRCMDYCLLERLFISTESGVDLTGC